MIRSLASAFAAYAFLCNQAALAEFILYTNRADFLAASAGVTTVDFEGVLLPGEPSRLIPTPPGLTLSGVNFMTDAVGSPRLFVVGDYYSGTAVLSSQQDVGNTAAVDGLRIALPGAFTAVAFEHGSLFATPLTVTLSTGDSFTLANFAQPSLTFIGLISTVPITSLRLEQSSNLPGPLGALNIDRFSFGMAVPEPSSLLLAGVGISCLLGCVRRRHRRSTWRDGTP